MSSSNYKVPADTLSIGGLRSTSTNFIAEDTLGDLATGEDASSANFSSCAGYQCFKGAPFIGFSIKEGTSAPGAAGAGVALGTLSTSSVKTSNGTTVNSIFITADSNARGGTLVTVRDTNSGLKRAATTHTIPSSTATLAAGTAGYGICVFSTTQHADSPTAFAKSSPYNGNCTKTTGHDVGILDPTIRTILSSTGEVRGGSSEILVKAAISNATVGGDDYQDTLTFIATGTY